MEIICRKLISAFLLTCLFILLCATGPCERRYSISGSVDGDILEGVTVVLSGEVSYTTTTDSNGDYRFSGLGNGSYTVTPSKSGYIFDPVDKTVSITDADEAGVDFISEETSSVNYQSVNMWPRLNQPWYFNYPEDIALSSDGSVYVADQANDRIQKFTSDGDFITKWGSRGSENGQFYVPVDIAVSPDGSVYVADKANDRIQKFTSDGEFITKWGSNGSGNGQFNAPNGIAISSDGSVYVIEYGNDRIQKFTSDGVFITKWGSQGSENGQFFHPSGIAVSSDGSVYVADTYNHRIQKFTSDGEFITKWGSYGSGDGQFNGPREITIFSDDSVYVADSGNYRIQKFTSDGEFITKWGSYGSGDGQFNAPRGIAISSDGSFYVVDTWNHRILKFTSEGVFITKWASNGSGDGQFNAPGGIAVSLGGSVYVMDTYNERIQKFTSEGVFITKWGSYGSGNGQFDAPEGIAVSLGGSVYVTDTENDRIQKFTSDGVFITKWGSEGSGDGQFYVPVDIAVSSDGSVYVADTYNHRIQKFTSDGEFITKWGSEGSGDGQFLFPLGIAVSSDGSVYVTDTENDRIQKFTSEGVFITKWGSYGSENGQFFFPYGITISSDGSVYVADTGNNRIQKFTSDGVFIETFGNFGDGAGQLIRPSSIAAVSNETLYIVEWVNNRVQVFKRVDNLSNNGNSEYKYDYKAIIVAGGGPYTGNSLWDSTQLVSNFAYRSLTFQGFNKDTIYYMTADTDLDLDGNGILDDVDGDITNDNLEYAITQWATDAKNVVIYITNHGGDGYFRMSGTEELFAEDLDSWIDEMQESVDGTVTVIYDACESGSFLPILTPPSGKERIVITSADYDEYAKFLQTGAVSFSFYFWNQIFGGSTLYESFLFARNAINATVPQTPLLDDNGNGTPNEEGVDGLLAREHYLGLGMVTAADIPTIGTISPDINLGGETSATIWVDDIVPSNSIQRVWAIVVPPDYDPGDTSTPITDLPSFELSHVSGSRYEGTYTKFNVSGSYQVSVYVKDQDGYTSIPLSMEVVQ